MHQNYCNKFFSKKSNLKTEIVLFLDKYIPAISCPKCVRGKEFPPREWGYIWTKHNFNETIDPAWVLPWWIRCIYQLHIQTCVVTVIIYFVSVYRLFYFSLLPEGMPIVPLQRRHHGGNPGQWDHVFVWIVH